MLRPTDDPGTALVPPAPRLASFVRHYWISSNAEATQHVIVPDGCLDLVVETSHSGADLWLYGTTTRRSKVSIRPQHLYVGVRFQPGQGRHFFRSAARELTDTRVRLDVDHWAPICDRLTRGGLDDLAIGRGFDQLLSEQLRQRPPERSSVDQALRTIVDRRGPVRVEELARSTGIGRRQLERLFLEQVGVSPKTYLKIVRARRVLDALFRRPTSSLSALAAELGYADQSHMSRELRELLGAPPGRLRAKGVAFVQDPSALAP